MKRRDFVLGGLGASVAAVVVGVWRSHDTEKPAPTPEEPKSGRAFPARYQTTLTALCNTLLPEAEKANAAAYVTQELSRPEMEGNYRLVLRGAAQLDKLARAKTSRAFHEGNVEERELVVQSLLQGEGAATRFDPSGFIKLMLALVLEGTFGDPTHGGNANENGWRAIGYSMGPPRSCLLAHGGSCR